MLGLEGSDDMLTPNPKPSSPDGLPKTDVFFCQCPRKLQLPEGLFQLTATQKLVKKRNDGNTQL